MNTQKGQPNSHHRIERFKNKQGEQRKMTETRTEEMKRIGLEITMLRDPEIPGAEWVGPADAKMHQTINNTDKSKYDQETKDYLDYAMRWCYDNLAGTLKAQGRDIRSLGKFELVYREIVKD